MVIRALQSGVARQRRLQAPTPFCRHPGEGKKEKKGKKKKKKEKRKKKRKKEEREKERKKKKKRRNAKDMPNSLL